MKRLIFARHADADVLFDELTESGQKQAKELAEYVRQYLGHQRTGLFSSPVGRVKATAEIVRDVTGVCTEIQVLQALNEQSGRIGYAQGLSKHLPDDVDVAVCFSHDTTIPVLASELLPRDDSYSFFDKGSALVMALSSDRWGDVSGVRAIDYFKPQTPSEFI